MMTKHLGPTLPISEETHAEKHRQPGESFMQAMDRLTRELGDSPKHSLQLHDVLSDQRFIPGGRVQAAIGAAKRVTAFNCFVSGTIADSLVVGEGNIMQRLTEAATTWAVGGGDGFDFSPLRPRNAPIAGLGSTSSGAVSFMGPFNSTAKVIKSAGHRRAATMGVLRVDHPDIEEFVKAKRDSSSLSEFNISVAVTDVFMRAVADDGLFSLTHGGIVYRQIRALDLWEQIMLSTWEWADPGVLFIDTINRMNNLWYCETIAATNPCGEQPLPPNGACNLGAFNLVKYLSKQAGFYTFAWDQFAEDIHVAHRAMDTVIDKAHFPLDAQRDEARAKRRMGLGVMGLANALEIMGMPYGSPEFVCMTKDIMRRLARESYLASCALAQERGSFPLFDPVRFSESQYVRTLDDDLRERIPFGMRNSHLNTVAPTGTTAITADNVTGGLEPVIFHEQERLIYKSSGEQVAEKIPDYAWSRYGVKGRTIKEVSIDEHLAVLAACQSQIDSACSKTCNVGADIGYDEFKNVYMRAWHLGAKGCTTYREAGSRKPILTDAAAKPDADSEWREGDDRITREIAIDRAKLGLEPPPENNACKYDPITGIRSCE